MLPNAPQSELIHAFQKDRSSIASLQGEVQDIILQLFGQNIHSTSEIDLLCSLLYYGITRSTPKGTLGEEHCDLMPVEQISSTNTPQLVPIVSESSRNIIYPNLPKIIPDNNDISLSNTHSNGLIDDTTSIPSSSSSSPSPQTQPPRELFMAMENILHLQPISPYRSRILIFCQTILPYLYSKLTQSAPISISPTLPIHKRFAYAIWNKCIELGRVCQRYAPDIYQIHLLLFFMFGSYYSIAHRFASVRYLSRTLTGPSIHFRLLGWLLAVKLLTSGISRSTTVLSSLFKPSQTPTRVLPPQDVITQRRLLRKRVRRFETHANILRSKVRASQLRAKAKGEPIPENPPSSEGPIGPGSYVGTVQYDEIVVSDADLDNSDYNSEEGDEDVFDLKQTQLPVVTSDRMNGSECAVCKEICTNTTATVCGHLYCWTCIAQSVANKPECPMCRTPCLPSQLLRLLQYK